ncbi:MAG: glycosyltransferase family 4 protein [Chloroflexi bacterium]|nr:MAG: glycosyltransferase family 4 protein [Chloroflexota bacterium]
MRVLMISKALVAGTSQRKLEELAKCPGVELTLVTPPHWQSDDGSKQVLERLYTGGYQMIVTPIRLNGNFHLHYYPRLGKIMRDVRPEVVHIDEEPYNFATFHAMRLANKQQAKALFFTWQNLYRDYPPPFRQMELYNYRHAAAALAGNRDAAEVLKRKGYSGPISIIPQFGFDTDIYQRTQPRQPRAPGDPFTLGFVGRLKDNKGLDLLVAALPELPHYCRVVFIGNGPMKEQLAQQAQRLGVAESSGEIRHVIGDAGLVFQEGHVQELVACIRQLLDDPELYVQLAAKGRQRVLENYTQEQIARQTYKVYQQMLV